MIDSYTEQRQWLAKRKINSQFPNTNSKWLNRIIKLFHESFFQLHYRGEKLNEYVHGSYYKRVCAMIERDFARDVYPWQLAKELYIKHIEPPPPPLPDKPTYKIAPLRPWTGMFYDMVPGENAPAFALLEHITNQMVMNGSTMRIGLYGPASVGKTTAARTVAECLSRHLFAASAEWFNPHVGHAGFVKAVGDTLYKIPEHREYPCVEEYRVDNAVCGVVAPCVVFIDEAHKLNDSSQNALLTITEAPYRIRHDHRYLDFQHVCFILATTDRSKLVKPLQTRLTSVTFQAYGLDSLTEIVQSKYPGFTGDLARRVALAGKLVPRSALQIAALLGDNPDHDLRRMFDIDDDGLDARDRQILMMLRTSYMPVDPVKVAAARKIVELADAGGRVTTTQLANAQAILTTRGKHKPIGLEGLSDRLGLTDLPELRERVNMLEQLGFVQRTSRGVIPVSGDSYE